MFKNYKAAVVLSLLTSCVSVSAADQVLGEGCQRATHTYALSRQSLKVEDQWWDAFQASGTTNICQ